MLVAQQLTTLLINCLECVPCKNPIWVKHAKKNKYPKNSLARVNFRHFSESREKHSFCYERKRKDGLFLNIKTNFCRKLIPLSELCFVSEILVEILDV